MAGLILVLKMKLEEYKFVLNSFKVVIEEQGKEIEMLKEELKQIRNSVRELDWRIFGVTKLK